MGSGGSVAIQISLNSLNVMSLSQYSIIIKTLSTNVLKQGKTELKKENKRETPPSFNSQKLLILLPK